MLIYSYHCFIQCHTSPLNLKFPCDNEFRQENKQHTSYMIYVMLYKSLIDFQKKRAAKFHIDHMGIEADIRIEV